MKKKFVMAVVAVVMAAALSVSAFAAQGVFNPSITGGDSDSSAVYIPESEPDSSEAAKAAYNTIVNTDGSVSDKLTALAGSQAVAEAAAAAGVESVDTLSIRSVGDVLVSGQVSIDVTAGGQVAVIMYLDANGQWKVTTAAVSNGQIMFNLPYPTTIVVLAFKAA